MEPIHQGGCLCGEVRYQVTGEPIFAAVCHCKQCQLRTGSAFGIGVYFKETKVQITQGNLKRYEYRSDESNRLMATEFCTNCGTTVTWKVELLSGCRGIASGTLDDPNWFKIDMHAWTRSAQHWMVYPLDIKKYTTQPNIEIAELFDEK